MRLDYYDILPAGMEAYLSNYGHHISKPMYKWAVSQMRDRNGKKAQPMDKEEVMGILRANSVEVERDYAYDVPYVYMMAKMDYYGSSIMDENHLAKYVHDYLDDIDGSDSRAFDELYVKTIALGIPIDWQDLI
jgi:hypothetical protein